MATPEEQRRWFWQSVVRWLYWATAWILAIAIGLLAGGLLFHSFVIMLVAIAAFVTLAGVLARRVLPRW